MKDYNDLTDTEQKEFNSKLLYAIKRFATCYLIAQDLIELAEKYKVFEQVKTGLSEILTLKDKN